MRTYKKRDLGERFWSKVDVGPVEVCWEWQAHTVRGYGGIKVDCKTKKAHRVAWELTSGPIPEDMCVLHKCDNPLCVNPSHLFLGTQSDNIQDRVSKGRCSATSGEAHYRCKLSDEQVAGIRSILDKGYMGQRAIGKLYGVSHQYISRLKLGMNR